MIDWLRRDPGDPRLVLEGRELPVAIRRHPHARRMTLRLAPDGSEVRVTLPRWGRTAEALAFAESRREWLAAQLAKCARAEPPAAGGTLVYRGKTLAIAWAAARCELVAATPAEDLEAEWFGGEAEPGPEPDDGHVLADVPIEVTHERVSDWIAPDHHPDILEDPPPEPVDLFEQPALPLVPYSAFASA